MNWMARRAAGSRLGSPRQAVGLAKGHRGDRVTVEIGHARRPDEQVAVGLLMRRQPFEPAPDRILVAALDGVNVAGAQERQQGQPGRGGVGLDPCVMAGTARPDTGPGNSGSTTRRRADAARSSPVRLRPISPTSPSPLRGASSLARVRPWRPENGADTALGEFRQPHHPLERNPLRPRLRKRRRRPVSRSAARVGSPSPAQTGPAMRSAAGRPA